MTIIVEDGTGLSTANSYASVAYAISYFEALNNTAWDALELEAQEAALRKATAYMTGRFRYLWKGYRKTSTQALDWPRVWVPIDDTQYYSYLSDTTVPTAVKDACVSLALRASSADLLADQERTKGRVKVEGAIDVEYDPHSPQTKRYPEIDAMLSGLLKGVSGVRMIRV